MSDTVFAYRCEDIDPDQEFEVKRVPDISRYLSDLLEVTDTSHPDYEDLQRSANHFNTMIKDKEEEFQEMENQDAIDGVQQRFPDDDLRLTDDQPTNNSTPSNNNTTSNNSSYNNSNNNSKDNTSNNDDDSMKDDKSNDSSNGSIQSTDDAIKRQRGGSAKARDRNSSGNLADKPEKPKRLSLRRRSAPSAVLFKTLAGNRSKSSASLWSNAVMGRKDSDNVINSQLGVDADSTRMFLTEGSVQLATGMQIQDRYIFLFSDLLLLAKQKSSTAFKLKHRIQLRDMWIASCVDEVCETTRPTERSFVVGWPTTNSVVTFPTVEEKDTWLRMLVDSITKEKLKDEDVTMELKVTPRDILSSQKTNCQMSITNACKADDVLVQCLKQMNIAETEAGDYQLWVSSGKEGTPYPLIGHETPFSIKRSQFRVTRSKSRDDISAMTSGDLNSTENGGTTKEKCEFYIKHKKGQKKPNLGDPSYPKKSKFKSPNFFSKLTSRIGKTKPQVFKQPLSECFTENNYPPDAIVKLLVQIYDKGPNYNGIMRRGNNHTLGKEIREKIESGQSFTIEDHHTPTVASVFKDFLRCIPGGLLTSKLESQWMAISKNESTDVKLGKIKEIMSQMPPQNLCLLTLTICLLQHIAKHKEHNNMSPTNLATCIAPSFLPDTSKPLPGKQSADSLMEVQHSMMAITNIVTPLITFMIVKHLEIFGEEILSAFVPFGCAPSPYITSMNDDEVKDTISSSNNSIMSTNVEDVDGDEEMFEEEQIRRRRHGKVHPATRQSNSGTDSDSTHSVLSMADNGVMLRRDDSSIDSLVDRDYYPVDSSPTVVKSHLSPSNLSRDSGLTLSDTQLYDEDGDIAMIPNKMYHRSTSHEDDLEHNEMSLYEQTMHSRNEPIAPPRSNRVRKRNQHNYSSSSKPAPFLHSASTTALDYLPSAFSKSSSGHHSHISTTPRSALVKKISSDSIGEEDDSAECQKTADFQRIRKGMLDHNMGTIVKSESGTHLDFKDDCQLSRFDLESGQRISSREPYSYSQQSSMADSTPPVSPNSRYPLSSVSNSTYSMSIDSPMRSEPQTPDSVGNEKPLSWSANQSSSKSYIPDQRLSHSLDINKSRSLSKSTPNINKDIDFDEIDDESDKVTQSYAQRSGSSYVPRDNYKEHWSDEYVQKPSSISIWGMKSHEAEEITPSQHTNFSLAAEEPEFHFHKKSSSLPVNDKHQSLMKGSPPPTVLLKHLSMPSRRESVPEKTSEQNTSPPHRRSSAETINYPPLNLTQSMSTVMEDEHIQSKPIMIPSPTSQEAQSISSRAKLSKYVVSSVELRPDKPPGYQQTLQRQFMIKNKVPVDIDVEDKQKQKENSYNAKTMYEKSLKLYNEQRKIEAEKISAKPFTSPETNDFVDGSRSKFKPVISQTVNKYYNPPELVQSGNSKDISASVHPQDNSGSAGFIDLGSISNSLQEDILKQRNAHGNVQNMTKSSSLGHTVSVSRTNSKLSDTGSSSGSSVTLSTLSRHSDSFSRHSDISNVTISSVTSSDSSSDTNSVMSRRRSGNFDNHNMSYSRHFRPVEPDNGRHSDEEDEEEEEFFEEVEYVILQRNDPDPQKLYQESMKLFEKGSDVITSQPPLTELPFSSISSSSSSSSASSVAAPIPHPTPSHSSLHHTVESKPQHTISKPTPQRLPLGIRRSESSAQDFQSRQTNNCDLVKPEIQRKSSLSEMQSEEHHNHFLKVRSLFYTPEEDVHQPSQLQSPRFHTSSKPLPFQPTQPYPKSNTTEKNETISTKSNTSVNFNPPPSTTKTSTISPPSTNNESKGKELPWNVKKLSKLFCDNVTTDSSIGSIQYDSTSRKPSVSKRSPPPYNNPPPFHRTQDNSRASTSSNSSVGSDRVNSSKSNFTPQRLGPQSASRDQSFNSSYSSSDESYNTDRRSQKSSLQDSESLSDYTSITYV